MKKNAFFKGLDKSLKKEHIRGLARQGIKGGVDSFFAMVPQWAAGKVFGRGRVNKATWKYLQRPALEADTAAGHIAQNVADTFLPTSMAKKLFTAKETVPTSKNRLLEFERPSVSAPLGHVATIATPLIVGHQLDKGVKKLQESSRTKSEAQKIKEREREKLRSLIQGKALKKVASLQTRNVEFRTDGPMEQEQLKKAASTMLYLHSENKKHEKRAQAERLLFKMAEAGLTELPRNFNEFDQKLASLMAQDLAVVEKALELSGGNLKLGELAGADSSNPQNATELFQATIMGELT